jgi:hypothetical protein
LGITALPRYRTIGSEGEEVNLHQQLSRKCLQPSTAHHGLDHKSSLPSLDLTLETFDVWWQRVFAQHVVLAAQASALIRAHRRVSASNRSHADEMN